MTVRDDRGSVLVEYASLLTLVALVCAAALVSVGPALLSLYRYQRLWLLFPYH